MKKVANYFFISTLAILFALCPLKSASAQLADILVYGEAIQSAPMQGREIIMIIGLLS